METMTMTNITCHHHMIIAQLRRDGNYDDKALKEMMPEDHSTTKTGWKL